MTDRTQAFDKITGYYKSFRPTYPDELVAEIPRHLGPAAEQCPRVAVDVGSGTGISTRQLSAVLGQAWTCIGVEPGRAMRQAAIEDGVDACVQFVDGSAESIPRDDGSVGIVLAAQAAQWFDRSRFYPEAARVLCPGGVIAILQNNRDWESSAFLDDYEALLEENSPGYSRHYRDFDYGHELGEAGFVDVRHVATVWTRPMSTEAFEGMAMSSTKMRAAVEATGEDVMRSRLHGLFARHGCAEEVAVPYKAEVFLGRAAGGNKEGSP